MRGALLAAALCVAAAPALAQTTSGATVDVQQLAITGAGGGGTTRLPVASVIAGGLFGGTNNCTVGESGALQLRDVGVGLNRLRDSPECRDQGWTNQVFNLEGGAAQARIIVRGIICNTDRIRHVYQITSAQTGIECPQDTYERQQAAQRQQRPGFFARLFGASSAEAAPAPVPVAQPVVARRVPPVPLLSAAQCRAARPTTREDLERLAVACPGRFSVPG